MRKVMWIGAAFGALFWTVICFAAYGLVDLFGGAASGVGTVPGFPVEPFSFAWFGSLAHRFGLGAVLLVWLAGVVGLGLFAFLGEKLFFGRKGGRGGFLSGPVMNGPNGWNEPKSWSGSFPPEKSWRKRDRKFWRKRDRDDD